jgi:hypothetical protein
MALRIGDIADASQLLDCPRRRSGRPSECHLRATGGDTLQTAAARLTEKTEQF